MKLVNGKLRVNSDETNPNLAGWFECLDEENGIYYNNIKVKLKKLDDGGIKITLDFPSKIVIMKDGVEKKIFFVKPITTECYKSFERIAVHCIRETLQRRNNEKSSTV